MRPASLFRLSLALSSFTLLAACSDGGAKAPAAKDDPPRLLYERNCAVCHGPQGQGTQLGTMKTPPLSSGAALTDTDEMFFKQISDGGKGMPPFKHTLDDRQIQDLVRHIREEFQGRR